MHSHPKGDECARSERLLEMERQEVLSAPRGQGLGREVEAAVMNDEAHPRQMLGKIERLLG